MKAIVIADDLTGAADCAAALWPRAQTVAWISEAEPAMDLDLDALDAAGALAFDLELRLLEPHQASHRLACCLERLRPLFTRRDDVYLYLKVDSALRGHVGIEARTAVHALGLTHLPVVPAYPGAGRTTTSGLHYVDGNPVNESPFVDDPHHPARTASVVQLLGAQGLTVAAGSVTDFTRWARSGSESAPRAFVPDVESEADLRAVAREMTVAGLRVACGAAGLLGHLQIEGGAEPIGPLPSIESTGGLVIVGTTHQRARLQLETLEHELGLDTIVVGPGHAGDLRSAREQLSRVGWAALSSPAERGSTDRAAGAALALARFVWQIDSEGAVDRLVIGGGETSYRVLEALEIRGFRTRGRVETGMPILEAEGQVRRWLAMKPGSLGDAHTLVRATRALTPRTTGSTRGRT